MALAFLRIGPPYDPKLEDDEIALGEPDDAEKRSLSLHVEKDTKRYRVMMRRLYSLARGNTINTLLLAAILLWMIFSSPQFAAWIGSVR